MPRRPAIVKLAVLRRPRLAVRGALVLVLALLFQQVALAAYLCPAEHGPAPAPMSMTDCADMPVAASTPLCGKHCHPDASTTPDVRVAHVPPLLLPPVRFALPGQLDSLESVTYAQVPVVRSDPPPTLRFCTLLI